MRSQPITPAIPEHCPACGALPVDDDINHRFFACGAAWSRHIHQFYSGCKTALTVMPELLAAAKRMLRALDEHELVEVGALRVVTALPDFRAAIGKAEGDR